MHPGFSAESSNPGWRVLVVEDDPETASIISDLVDRFERFEGGKFETTHCGDFDEARRVLPVTRPDILVLDMFVGNPSADGPSAGEQVLVDLKQTAFLPVVIYTALPDRFESYRSPFVQVLKKGASPAELQPILRTFLEKRIPQMMRALRTQFDHTLRDYLWRFVERHAADFRDLIATPDFGRLLVDRLAESFTHEGVETVLSVAYGLAPHTVTDPDSVHPSACYVLPATGAFPRLGDLRKSTANSGWEGNLVVLQPSCDLISIPAAGPRKARIPVSQVLCAPVKRLDQVATEPGDLKRYRENRKSDHEQALPAFMNIPDILIDFQELQLVPYRELMQMPLTVRIASPFAERIAARFAAYIGRIGTPSFQPAP